MLDHVNFGVRDIERSAAFYDRALAPLGIARLLTYSADGRTRIGYGHAGKPYFWINGRGRLDGYLHVAFGCADRGTVDAFHTAALAAGGRDNGAPGPRPEYHPNYYGAFVLDPDGHNVEAVCHVGE